MESKRGERLLNWLERVPLGWVLLTALIVSWALLAGIVVLVTALIRALL